MTTIINFLLSLFKPRSTTAETECPHCRGLGYDASGYWCRCGEKV